MMTPETDGLRLQVGGAVNPRTSVYIVRPADDELLSLLARGEYCNVLCSRQTGKTSLLKRTKVRLAERGYDTAEIEIAGYLGSPQDTKTWYQGLLQGIAQQLDIQVDVCVWWETCRAVTPNQRFIQFFHDEVVTTAKNPIVIFLDEIDSTLKLPYTDDLFVAVRSMYNDRVSEPAYEQLTFCLVGVATPNELIKDHRTTPYNIGKTIELQDFDHQRDDLSLLLHAISDDLTISQVVVEEVLSWTGGHPYLTLRVCEEFVRQHGISPGEVGGLIRQMFANLESLQTDTHFAPVLRFLSERVDDKLAVLNEYRRIWHGKQVRDQISPAHVALKLAGIVKRDLSGRLVVRNAIYHQIFNDEWIASTTDTDTKQYEHAIAAAAYAEQTLRQELENYRVAFGAYQSLCENLAYTGNLDELWAAFLERCALRAEQSQKRDEALLWRLKALDIQPVDNCVRAVRDLIGMDYAHLVVTFRHRGEVKIGLFLLDGETVFTVSENGTAQVWQIETGQPVGEPMRHQGAVWAVACSPDGKTVLIGSEDGTAQVWQIETGQPVGEPMRHQGAVWAVAFSPDGNMVLTGSEEGTAQVWQIETGQPVGEPMRHQGAVWAVAFSPDGKTVLTGSDDGMAQVWQTETSQPVGEPMQHRGMVLTVAFSSDGKTVLTGSEEGTAQVWQTETGKPVNESMRYQDHVWAMAFSPDGKTVLTGSEEGTAQVWQTETGQPVGEPMRHQGAVEAVAYSPDGKTVLTASVDGTSRLWRVGCCEPMQHLQGEPAELLEVWQKKLGLQINEAGEVVPLYP